MIYYYTPTVSSPLSMVLQIIRTQDSKSLSAPMIYINTINNVFWIAYGIETEDTALLCSNGISLVIQIRTPDLQPLT